MTLFAIIGFVNLILGSVIVTALPFCLAVWHASAAWLWLYAVYAVLILVFIPVIGSFKQEQKEKQEEDGES